MSAAPAAAASPERRPRAGSPVTAVSTSGHGAMPDPPPSPTTPGGCRPRRRPLAGSGPTSNATASTTARAMSPIVCSGESPTNAACYVVAPPRRPGAAEPADGGNAHLRPAGSSRPLRATPERRSRRRRRSRAQPRADRSQPLDERAGRRQARPRRGSLLRHHARRRRRDPPVRANRRSAPTRSPSSPTTPSGSSPAPVPSTSHGRSPAPTTTGIPAGIPSSPAHRAANLADNRTRPEHRREHVEPIPGELRNGLQRRVVEPARLGDRRVAGNLAGHPEHDEVARRQHPASAAPSRPARDPRAMRAWLQARTSRGSPRCRRCDALLYRRIAQRDRRPRFRPGGRTT